MPIIAHGFELTVVDTTQKHPLGMTVELPPTWSGGHARTGQGRQVWVYVFNDEAATAFAQGHLIARDAATTTYDGILAAATSPTMRLLGVAQHTIAFGSYGWILKEGIGEVMADVGTITTNTSLLSGAAAGKAANAAAVTDHAFAFATEGAALNALATCMINCPG